MRDILKEAEDLIEESRKPGSETLHYLIYALADELRKRRDVEEAIPLVLTCPSCGERHIDEGVFSVKLHHTHACQSCGMVWRPAVVYTVGVRFLPGFKI